MHGSAAFTASAARECLQYLQFCASQWGAGSGRGETGSQLAPIRYALASLSSGSLSAERRYHAEEVIERQVANMSRLLDDLLNVSRVSMGKIALEKQHISLRTVLDAAVEAALPSLEAKGHSLCRISMAISWPGSSDTPPGARALCWSQ